MLVMVLNSAFAAMVLRQFTQRRRPYQAAWAAALLLGALAALFYLVFLRFLEPNIYFKLYYLCGGVLMAAYLGLGSVYLHAGRRVGGVVALLLVVMSLIAAGSLLSAPTDAAKLHHAAATLGPGTNALGAGAWKAFTAVLNSFGALAVVAGAVWSAYRTVRRDARLRFVWSNVLIASGTLIAGVAGFAADQGTFAGSFWAVLCAGFIVLFSGFLLASSGPPARPVPVAESRVGTAVP